MATLSFTASNGKRYSLLSLSSKLTTPSLKVGSSYVPRFTGSAESEVTSGEYIYTLSPMKVGSTHAAYKRRFTFTDLGHVYINVTVCGTIGNWGGISMSSFSGYWNSIYTNTAGYTAHASITSTNEGSTGLTLDGSHYYYWNGTYTVTHDASGSTVASGTFSVGATATFTVYGAMNCESPTFTIK